MKSAEYYAKIVEHMGELHKHLRRIQSKLMEEYGISLMEYHILASVLKMRTVSQNGLAELLDVDKALISRQIQSMERKGLIRCSDDPECRRKKLLVPTDKALELMPRLDELQAGSLERVFSGIDEQQLNIFHQILEGMVSRI